MLEAIYWATWYPRAIHSRIRQIDISFVVCLSSSLVCAFEKLRRSLSKSGPVQYGKIIFFWAKIASALKRQFLTTPNIKYGTNCRARLFTKFSCEVLFCFTYLDKPFLRTNNINFVLLTVFFHFFFFVSPTLTLLAPCPEICNFLSQLSAKFQLLAHDIFIQTG